MTPTRLSLPGTRSIWWALGVLAVALPFGLMIGHSAPSEQSAMETLRFQVRVRNVMWRMTQLGEGALQEQDRKTQERRDQERRNKQRTARKSETAAEVDPQPASDEKDTDAATPSADDASVKPAAGPPAGAEEVGLKSAVAPEGDAAAKGTAAPATTNDDSRRPSLRETPVTVQRLAASKEVMEKAIIELFDHTQSDAGKEMVIAHAIAVEATDTATRLASRLTKPSDAIRAALAATAPQRGDSPASPLAMGVTPANAIVSGKDFGGGWGPFIRQRVRARVHALAGDRRRARKANDALAWSDGTLLPLFYTLLQALLMAGVFGVGIWFFGALRVQAARKQGLPALGWLLMRHPGLGDERPFLDDRLVPLLGFGAWLMVYLLAGVLIKLIPGPRSAVGFEVLFQSLSGAVFAAWIISSFSQTPLPLDAARLRPNASGVSPWRASTSALWAYCAVLPPMMVVALVNLVFADLFGMDDAAPHPVVGMLLEDGDPMQVGALAAAVIIGAPLGEELIFRGFLYRSLKQHTGVFVSALISGAIFSLVHMAPAAFLPYMMLGVAFALVFEWTGSLWTSIFLHGLWNAVVFGCMAVITLS